MTLPRADEPYRVLNGRSFQESWNAGVREGWLNPMVHPSDLLHFRRVLSENPRIGQVVPGAAVDVRAIRFPRSVTGPAQLEIVYSVFEDDRTVYLEHISMVP